MFPFIIQYKFLYFNLKSDSISPVSPLKRPRKSSPISQQDSTKLDFGGFGKLSSSNYKSTNSIINAFPVKQTVSLYNSLKKNDAKAFFNDTKPLFHDKKNSETRNLLNNRETLKTSFLKGRDSIGNNIVDLGGLNEISERLRGLGGREIESLSNSQVKELLNLANLITKIAKNTKYYN